MKRLFIFLAIFLPFFGGCQNQNPSTKVQLKKKPMTTTTPSHFDTATIGGGCFWCTEAMFAELKGVQSAVSGYSGGTVKNPTYKEVCAGTTGHAEVIQVVYDPTIITFAQLMQVFFLTHDPTTLNRQGNDIGTQYRSVIFYRNEEEKRIAQETIAEVATSGVYSDRIVTTLEPFEVFYKAEDYHQDYFSQNSNQPYCSLVINPKLMKFRKTFESLLK